MIYLHPSALSAFVNSGKVLEQFISPIQEDSIAGFRWISIEKDNDSYELSLHDVMDDRPEIESIYHFSYFEPDDLYGKVVIRSDELETVLQHADGLGAKRDRYLPYGNLDELEWS